jgi:hypothetical protein
MVGRGLCFVELRTSQTQTLEDLIDEYNLNYTRIAGWNMLIIEKINGWKNETNKV